MKLAELQRFFAEVATSNTGPKPELERVFAGDAQLSAQERLGIYNRAYYFRLLDALASVFERTKLSLGEAEFQRVGLAYLAEHPSEHPAVERVGRQFPEFLSTRVGSLSAGLAALEWARLCALVAPNARAAVSASAVAQSDFPCGHFHFAPSLRWLEVAEGALAAFAADAPSALGSNEICAVAVWRNGYAVQHERLALSELAALRVAATGAPVSDVCASFPAENEAQAVQLAFQALAGWFRRGWVESLD
jgi:hypothetical protein